jgi:hypothetical protein
LFIRLNADFFEGFAAELGDDVSLEDYLDWVSKATRDAGQLEIVAFSWAFKAVMNIVYKPGYDFHCNDDKAWRPMYLLYVNNNHYESAVLVDESQERYLKIETLLAVKNDLMKRNSEKISVLALSIGGAVHSSPSTGSSSSSSLSSPLSAASSAEPSPVSAAPSSAVPSPVPASPHSDVSSLSDPLSSSKIPSPSAGSASAHPSAGFGAAFLFPVYSKKKQSSQMKIEKRSENALKERKKSLLAA